MIKEGLEAEDGRELYVLDRIAKCRKAISKWKRSTETNSRFQMQKLQITLEQEISKRNQDRQVMRQLKFELAVAHNEEEKFWREKSKEQWLKEGDRNTNYFHNCVKGKQIKNKVLMLLDEMDIEQFSEGEKEEVAVNFYRDLFMSSNPFDLESIFEGLKPQVTATMNADLTAPISQEEIKTAAFSVKNGSHREKMCLQGFFINDTGILLDHQ